MKDAATRRKDMTYRTGDRVQFPYWAERLTGTVEFVNLHNVTIKADDGRLFVRDESRVQPE